VKYALIRRNRRVWPIRVQCRMLGVSVAGYHEHFVRRLQIARRRHLSAEALLVHIRAVYAANRGAYGWPRIWRELHVSPSLLAFHRRWCDPLRPRAGPQQEVRAGIVGRTEQLVDIALPISDGNDALYRTLRYSGTLTLIVSFHMPMLAPDRNVSMCTE
jgi:hypothetical protein